MFHLVYYAKSLNFSPCLEGVPLEFFKKLGYCSWLSRIVLCTKSGIFGFFLRFKYVLGSVDAMMMTHIQVLVGQGLCRL